MTKRAFAEVTMDGSPSEVSNALDQIMLSSRIQDKEKTITETPFTIHLIGEHSATFRSFGEIIRITITKNGNGSKVKAESESMLPTTIFDYGQNKENLEILLNQLVMKFRSISPLVIEERTF
jgi:hypothetical protein